MVIAIKNTKKVLYDEALGTPYQADAPLILINPKGRDWNYNTGRTIRYYDSAKIWLSK